MIYSTGGDGSSYEKAIVILGAEGSWDGVEYEHLIIEEMFEAKNKEGRQLGQELCFIKNKHYDHIYLEAEDGERFDVWFDITDFFGKFEEDEFNC